MTRIAPDSQSSNGQQATDGTVQQLRAVLNQKLRGKPEVIEWVLAALLARGHLLIEDLPGLGKTTLAKALASGIGGSFSRVQCTPDLLPGDITGYNIFNQKTREFDFKPGPVFADILLADEINRATPRTQSALLEAMGEQQVTVDNRKYDLSSCFFVIATQNPCDHHGTYPLPEAQLDRFAMKLKIGYADRSHELAMLAADDRLSSVDQEAPAILDPKRLVAIQEEVLRMGVADKVRAYLVDLVHATRAHSRITLGLSPRAMLMWQRLAKAWAWLNERNYVIPDDVQAVAYPVLCVHLGQETTNHQDIVKDILSSTAVPS